MRVSIAGCGTLGTEVASLWPGPVHAVTATERRHAALKAIRPDLTVSTTVTAGDPLVIAAPSSTQADVLDALERQTPPSRAVFVSSTGVYGSPTGRVIADTPPGDTDRAQRLFALEQRFRAWCPDGSVLRLGGLYDAERGPAAVFARTGTTRLAPPNRVLPLIHYRDAARLVVQLLEQPQPTLLGVVHQPTRQAYYTALAEDLGIDPPAFSEPIADPWRFETVELDDPQPWRPGHG